MEYYKNLMLEDLFYINDNGLVCCEKWEYVHYYKYSYKISDLGRLKSFKNNKERILKQGLGTNGYLLVGLCENSIIKTFYIHQLVAEAFLNHIPCGYELVVNHKDTKNPNNKLDNRLQNLEIITQRVNADKKHLKSSSKYIGVSWRKIENKWESRININGKKKHLGFFYSEEEASEYYQNALKSYQLGLPIEVKKPIYSSKYKGVSYKKVNKKWSATITLKGKQKYLGLFYTEIDAYNACQNYLLEIK